MDLLTFLECFPDTLVIVYDENGNIIFPEDKNMINYMKDCLVVSDDEYFHAGTRRYYKINQMVHSKNNHTYHMLRFTDITEYKKMQKAYQIDETTGIFLKRKLIEDYKKYIVEALDKNEDYAIIMSDIDYFKKVNDNYGHQAGDASLHYIAQIFLQNTRHGIRRRNDIISRFGGEEFLLILKNIKSEYVLDRVESMRKIIAENPCIYKDDTIKLTCSFGAVHVNSSRIKELFYEEEDVDKVMAKTIQLADEQLYAAKETGRNKVNIKYY